MMKAKSYPLALMAAVVLASVTLAFSQSPEPTLVELSNAKNAIEDQVILYKAMSEDTSLHSSLKDHRSTVVRAYGEVKSKYEAFKSFVRGRILQGGGIKAIEKTVREDKTYLPALKKSVESYKKELDAVYAKGLKIKPLMGVTEGFDPSTIVAAAIEAIVEFVKLIGEKSKEQREKLLETLNHEAYTLKEYSEIKGAY